VVDANAETARVVADTYGCGFETSWENVAHSDDVDVVVAATPNAFLRDIAVASLNAGKHVLIEKPMGRNAAEAEAIADAAAASGRLLKIGFNHRYHPAVARARQLVGLGAIGDLINIRARYGHGGRAGYEREWRGNAELAGGGELTDQGVHVCDLINWFAGRPSEAFAYTQTAVWPIRPLEDNAFGLFRYDGGRVASFHTSWTQWKNMFSFEIFGTGGSLAIEGLGKSYGTERLIQTLRNAEGGVPDQSESTFDGPDDSWRLEWADFVAAILDGTPYLGTPEDGVTAMRMIDALYASVREHRPIALLSRG
jgi:predicted dehydrogenase